MAYGKFTSYNIEDFQKQLNAFLSRYGIVYGVDFTVSELRHNDVSLSFKVNGVLNSKEAQNAITLEKKNTWNEYCEELGLEKADFGRVVSVRGRSFKVRGLNIKRKLICLSEVAEGGKNFFCTPADFKKMKENENGNREKTN